MGKTAILIQLLGGVGIAAGLIAFQCKKHKSILLCKTMSEFLFAVQYFLLSAYTGMAMNLIGCVRNIIFAKQVEKNRKTTMSVVTFSALFVILGIVTWQGPKSILTIVAKVLSTTAYGNKNPAIVRGITFVTSSCWLIYNIMVSSWAGVACELFTLLSLLVAFVRFSGLRCRAAKK